MTPQLLAALERTDRDQLPTTAAVLLNIGESAFTSKAEGWEHRLRFCCWAAALVIRYDEDPALCEVGHLDASLVDTWMVSAAAMEMGDAPGALDSTLQALTEAGGLYAALAREFEVARLKVETIFDAARRTLDAYDLTGCP